MLLTLRLGNSEIAKDKNSFIYNLSFFLISKCSASVLTLLTYIFPRINLFFKTT